MKPLSAFWTLVLLLVLGPAAHPFSLKAQDSTTLPEVSLRTIDGRAMEQSPYVDSLPDTARFEVIRNGGDQDLLVFYQISGTAENGVDYVTLPGHVVIPTGSDSAEIQIVPLDDLIFEGTETIVLELEAPLSDAAVVLENELPNYRIGEPALARAELHDDDPPPAEVPPRVVLVSPTDESRHALGMPIRLAAGAGDPDGWVEQVEFFANHQSLGIVYNENRDDTAEQPFTVVWENAPTGPAELTAVATDNDGLTARSEPIHIVVLDPCSRTHVWITATDPVASEPWIVPPLPPPPPSAITTDFESSLTLTEIDRSDHYAQDTATLRISRRACDVSFPLTVFLRIGGTAENGKDYDAIPFEAVIPADQWHADITIRAIDDALEEDTETVVIELLPPPCIAIEPPPPECYLVEDTGRAVAFIRDNDHAENELPKIAVARPASGTAHPLGEPIRIVAVAADPDGWIPLVEFYANDQKIGEQQINFIREPDPGQEQRFEMVWSPERPGGYDIVVRATDDRGGSAHSSASKIQVADPYPVPEISVVATDSIGSEYASPLTVADPAFNPAEFTLYRTARYDVDLEVHYAIGGTASNGQDYLPLAGVAVIRAGESSTVVRVNPIDDAIVEGPESVVLELLPAACPEIWPPHPSCYQIGDASRAVAFIRDNDHDGNHPPHVALVDPSAGEVFRSGDEIELVAVARDPDGWVPLVEFFDGRRKIGEATIQFIQEPPPGERQQFTHHWSPIESGVHTLIAVATDNLGGRSISDPVAIIVQGDNGPPVVTLHSRDSVAAEPGESSEADPAHLRVMRTGPTDQPLTVFYALGGSAENGTDYEYLSGELLIPTGRRSGRITVLPLEDNITEELETVLVKLIAPVPVSDSAVNELPQYIVGHPDRAAATIRDNQFRSPDCFVLPDGMISLRLNGVSGTSYRLQYTTDFEEWHSLGEQTADNGEISFIETEGTTSSQRFYRLVESIDALRAEDELDGIH